MVAELFIDHSVFLRVHNASMVLYNYRDTEIMEKHGDI